MKLYDGTYPGTSASLYSSVLDSVIDTMRRDSFSEKEVIDVVLNVLKSQDERHWNYMCQRECDAPEFAPEFC